MCNEHGSESPDKSTGNVQVCISWDGWEKQTVTLSTNRPIVCEALLIVRPGFLERFPTTAKESSDETESLQWQQQYLILPWTLKPKNLGYLIKEDQKLHVKAESTEHSP